MRTLLTAALFLLCLPFVSHFCKDKTDGFTLLSLATCEKCDLASPSVSSEESLKIGEILSQPFHYLARGGQSFAFVSDDGNYVLKFFRSRFAPTFLLQIPLPSAWENAIIKKENFGLKKLRRDLLSYSLAYDELKSETGLLFLHLKNEKSLHHEFHLYDKLGILHTIDPNKTLFVLQKKATPLYPYIDECMRKKDIEGAKQALVQIVEIFTRRCKKGIFDEDPRLHKNLGFIDGRAIFIDAGRFKKDPERKRPEIYRQDLLSMTDRFKAWLREKHPILEPYFEQLIDHEEKD